MIEKKKNNKSEAVILRKKAIDLLKKKKSVSSMFNSLKSKQDLPIPEAEILKLIYELEVHQIELELQNAELSASNSLLNSSLESTTDGILVVNIAGEINKWNKKFAEMWQLSEKVLSNNNDAFVINSILSQLSEPDQFLIEVKNLYSHPDKSSFDQIRFIDGRVFERYSQPQRIGYEIVGRVWSFRDITRRIQTETALRHSEEKYRNIFENIQDVFYQTDLSGVITDISPSIEYFAEYKSEELIGNNVSALYENPDDRGILLKILYKFGQVRDYELTLRTKVGEIKHVSINARLIYNIDGINSHIEGVIRDITERKRAEQELAKQKHFFEQMFVQSSVSTQILDKDGWCERINPKLSELFGVEPQNIEGRLYNIFKDEAIKQGGVIQYLKRVFNEGKSAEWEVSFDIGVAAESQNIIVKEKKKEWFYNWSYPIFDENGKVSHVVIQHNNISERKYAEEALRKSREEFRGYFELGSIGMCVTSPEKGWIEVNDCLCQMLGYSKKELSKFTWADLTHPDDLDADVNLFNQVLAGKRDKYEIDKRFIRKDGTSIYTTLSVSCQRNADGSMDRMLASLLDITERKQVEKNLSIMNERLNLALKASNFGVWDRDVQKNELVWDNRMFELYGFSKNKFQGIYETWLNCLHPEDLERCKLEIQLALEGKKDYNTEFRAILPDGSMKYIKAYGYVDRDSSGNPLRLTGINFDISESKLAELALKESEERYSIFINSNDDMTFLKNEMLEYQIVNKAQANFFAKEPDDIIGKTDFELMPAEAAQHSSETDDKALTSDSVIITEEIVGDKILETHKFRVPLPGDTFGVGGYIIDITKRKRSELLIKALNQAAIKMSNDLTLEDIFNTVSNELKKLDFFCMLFPLDDTGKKLYTTFINYDFRTLNILEKIVGTEQEHFVMNIDDFDELKKVVYDKETIFVEDIAIFLKNVMSRPFKIFGKEIFKDNKVPKNILAPLIIGNKVVGVFSVQTNDLTQYDIPAIKAFAMQMASAWDIANLFQNLKNNLNELEKAETELSKSEERFKQVAEIAGEWIWEVDQTGLYTYSSKMSKSILGYEANEIVGKKYFFDFFDPSVKEELKKAALESFYKKESFSNFENPNIHKNGKKVIVLTNGLPILDEMGNLLGYRGADTDITKRKSDEASLKKSREELKKFALHLQDIREEERIMLAREIHDELGQILVAIKIDMGMLKQKVLKGIDNTGTEDLLIKIDRLFSLVDKTIKTTRKIMTDLRPEMLDMLGFVEAVKLHMNEFQERHKIKCQINSTISKLEIDSKQSVALFRIYQEALTNVAKHSMATEVMLHLRRKADKLIMEISDNGIGIDKDQKIKTNSYGLIGMKERIQLLEGEIFITGSSGKGTSIRIEIPYSK